MPREPEIRSGQHPGPHDVYLLYVPRAIMVELMDACLDSNRENLGGTLARLIDGTFGALSPAWESSPAGWDG